MGWQEITAIAAVIIGSFSCYFVVRKWFNVEEKDEKLLFAFCMAFWPEFFFMLLIMSCIRFVKKLIKRGKK